MKENKKTLIINKLDGTNGEVQEVISFEFNDTKKRYIIYTKKETDQNGNVTIYVTELIKDIHGARLGGVATDEEWSKIKDVLRELAKNSSISSIRIFENSELVGKADQIRPAKKLKTRSGDFANILRAGNVETKPLIEEKEDDFEEMITRKPEKVAPISREEMKPSYINELPKEEKPSFEAPVNAYNAVKEEENIDLKNIQKLENIYGGRQNQTKLREEKKPVEEPKEEIITEEMYREELEKESFSPEAANYKENLRNQYNVLKQKIANQKSKIDDITREYATESELSNKIKEEKKDIQKVLNGMNSWQMEFLAKFKDEARTKTLLNSIEDYFASYRKDLEDKIRAEKNCESRKEALGKSEQKAREEYTESKKHLEKHIKDNYGTLEKVEASDEALRKRDKEIKDLTGATGLDSLRLNAEKVKQEPSFINPLNRISPTEDHQRIPELNTNIYEQPASMHQEQPSMSNTQTTPNIFDVFRRAANDDVQ